MNTKKFFYIINFCFLIIQFSDDKSDSKASLYFPFILKLWDIFIYICIYKAIKKLNAE